MARSELRALLGILALLASGCDRPGGAPKRNSVTVKLPPARPQAPAPAFTFKDGRT